MNTPNTIATLDKEIAQIQHADAVIAARPVPDLLLNTVRGSHKSPDPKGILRGLKTTVELLKVTEQRLASLSHLAGDGEQGDLREDIEAALHEVLQQATECQHELHDVPGHPQSL